MDFQTRQETLKNILTCGICRKLSREVTLIEECCHTFCWKCISEKIEREKCRNCPQCNADLGGAPLQRIKTDYKLQSMRDKFNNMRKQVIDHGLMKPKAKDLNNKPSNDQARNGAAAAAAAEPLDRKGKGKVREDVVLGQAPEILMGPRERKGKGKLVIHDRPYKDDDDDDDDEDSDYFPGQLPFSTRRKKRSITSLVGGNRAAAQPRLGRGHRTRKSNINITRKVLPPRKRRAYFSAPDDNSTNSDTDSDYFPSPKHLGRFRKLQIKEQEYSYASEPLNEPHDSSIGDHDQPMEEMNNLLKPENHEVALVDQEPASSVPSASRKRRRGWRKKHEKKVLVDHHHHHHHQDHKNINNSNNNINIDPTEKKILIEDLNIPTHIVIDPAIVYNKRPTPVWFQLVASNIKSNCGTLPSLPPCYIQVKDVNMTASFIKKYLVVKLGLDSEDQVEISMRGEPVHPDTQMRELMELWVETAKRSESKRRAAFGGSGKEFVMVFGYSMSSGADPF